MTVTVTNHRTGTTLTSGLARIGDTLRESVPWVYTRDADLAAIEGLEARLLAGEDFTREAAALGVTIALS